MKLHRHGASDVAWEDMKERWAKQYREAFDLGMHKINIAGLEYLDARRKEQPASDAAWRAFRDSQNALRDELTKMGEEMLQKLDNLGVDLEEKEVMMTEAPAGGISNSLSEANSIAPWE